MRLSIIIPAYNEERTISSVLKKVIALKIPQVEKEIIVVNDGSTDGTASEIQRTKGKAKNIVVINNKTNKGKGYAVRTGIRKSKADYIAIQDADLEYDPKYILKLIAPVLKGKAQVVYGTRLKRWPNFSRDERNFLFLTHYLGNKFLSLITSILYLSWVTDMETGSKLLPAKAVRGMNLDSRGFDFEPEITAKLLRKGYKILEVPISTYPRGYAQGKKLNTCKDGIKALAAIIKYRFTD